MSAAFYRLAGQQLQQLSKLGNRLCQVPKAIAEPRLQSTSAASPGPTASSKQPIPYSKLTVGAPAAALLQQRCDAARAPSSRNDSPHEAGKPGLLH